MHFRDNPVRTTLYAALGTALAVAVLFLWADIPVDRWTHGLKGSALYHLGKSLSLAASGTLWQGAAALCLALGCLGRALRPANRWSGGLVLVGVSVAAAMVAGESLKYLFGRYRPMEFLDHGLYGFTFFSSKYMQNSFPSGHTYRIFSAMTALGLVLPRGRNLFLALATAVALSRVVVCKHYPSDIVFGAFIGIICALWTGWMIAPERRPLPCPQNPAGTQ